MAPPRIRLYEIHGSHPCAAVARAIELKGLHRSVWEWPPPMHALGQRLLFGERTVPAVTIDGAKLTGSTAIMHRLDELVPEPRLFPEDPDLHARVEDAERWGNGDFQQLARDLIWVAMGNAPAAISSYTTHSKLPLPDVAARLLAPGITAGERLLNRTGAEKARRRLAQLPADLDRIDAWIADGTIGDPDQPNAADLQILSTVRLLSTLGDVRAMLDGRPCDRAARALFPQWDGEIPAGTLS